MYDISQLNDMLVPELQDIADQHRIPNYKKLEKDDLITRILDKQKDAGKASGEEKPKRKRKPIEAKGDEAPVAATPEVQEVEEKPKQEAKPVRRDAPADRKKIVRKPEPSTAKVETEEEEDLQPITSEQSTVPAAIASLLQEED
ncbi:MAG: Rho termination factor N-terminal domain-containing protein, partial [Ferruginibacter sp.]